MAKGNLKKEFEKCKHPKSRKTLALARKVKKMNNRTKLKLGNDVKTSILGDKLAWFSEHVASGSEALTPKEFQILIEKYLHRFDDELEQIKLKQSISKNRKNQHASRESVIKLTLEREKNEYNSGGMELVNLCDFDKMKSLIDWDGTPINVQHLKLDLISRNFFKKSNEIKEKPKIIITPPDEEQKPMEE